jgi:hypothetical protein
MASVAQRIYNVGKILQTVSCGSSKSQPPGGGMKRPCVDVVLPVAGTVDQQAY